MPDGSTASHAGSDAAAGRPADDEAFAAMLQQVKPRLRAFLARLAGGRIDVEDVLQEALAKVWRLRHTFDPRQPQAGGAPWAWLQQAAFRTFCDHWRRQRQQPATHDALHLAAAPSAPCAIELRDELEVRLARLSAIERALLLGFHRDGHDLIELSRRHALPVNTIKSHLHRARRRLRTATGDET